MFSPYSFVNMFGNRKKGGFPVRKKLSLLCVILLSCLVSCAFAQTIPCPEAHLVLTVPDNWEIIPVGEKDDPGLCLLLENGEMNLSVYVDNTGGLFEVFTGDDTESTTVNYGGVQMTCVSGESDEGSYRIYTWLDERDQVQFYFLITDSSRSARGLIEDIMGSIQFD